MRKQVSARAGMGGGWERASSSSSSSWKFQQTNERKEQTKNVAQLYSIYIHAKSRRKAEGVWHVASPRTTIQAFSHIILLSLDSSTAVCVVKAPLTHSSSPFLTVAQHQFMLQSFNCDIRLIAFVLQMVEICIFSQMCVAHEPPYPESWGKKNCGNSTKSGQRRKNTQQRQWKIHPYICISLSHWKVSCDGVIDSWSCACSWHGSFVNVTAMDDRVSHQTQIKLIFATGSTTVVSPVCYGSIGNEIFFSFFWKSSSGEWEIDSVGREKNSMRPIASSIKWKCMVENRFGISNHSLICQASKNIPTIPNVCLAFIFFCFVCSLFRFWFTTFCSFVGVFS